MCDLPIFKAYETAFLLDFVKQQVDFTKKDWILDYLQAVDVFSEEKRRLMHANSEKRFFLAKIWQKYGVKNLFEWGTFVGSTALWAKQHSLQVYTVERSRPMAQYFEMLLQMGGIDDIFAFRGGVAALLPVIQKDNTAFDMIWVDHEKKLYKDDLINAKKLGFLQKNVLIGVDNAKDERALDALIWLQEVYGDAVEDFDDVLVFQV